MSSLSKSKILITGASGFIGSHLIERLASEGAQLLGLSRTRGHLDNIGANKVEFAACDLADLEQVKTYVGDFNPDIVFHFASHPDSPESYEQSLAVMQTNLMGTLNLLEALRHTTHGALIYGDTCKVYGAEPPPYSTDSKVNPNSSYAIAKAAGWQLCLLYRNLYGLKVVSIRPTIVYGPRQPYNIFKAVLDKIAQGEESIAIDGGTQTRDPLYIADLIDLCLLVWQNIDRLDGMVLNCGGGSEISVVDLISLLVELSESDITVQSCPERMRKTELLRCFCDNLEAERHVGWKPKISLVEGIQSLIKNKPSTEKEPPQPLQIPQPSDSTN